MSSFLLKTDNILTMLLRMVFSWNDTVYALVEHAHLHFCFQKSPLFRSKSFLQPRTVLWEKYCCIC